MTALSRGGAPGAIGVAEFLSLPTLPFLDMRITAAHPGARAREIGFREERKASFLTPPARTALSKT
jgi:hypothetical protein